MTRPIGAARAPRTPGASDPSSSQPENVSGPRTRRMTRASAAAAATSKNASPASQGPATPAAQATPSTASTQVVVKSRLVLVPTANAVAKERLERELAMLKSAVSALSARIEAASSDDSCSTPAPTAADEPPKPRHFVYNVSSLLIEVLTEALAP